MIQLAVVAKVQIELAIGLREGGQIVAMLRPIAIPETRAMAVTGQEKIMACAAQIVRD